MHATIEIDDELLDSVMKFTGATSVDATVEEALKLTQKVHGQTVALEGLWGIGWEGDLATSRLGRLAEIE